MLILVLNNNHSTFLHCDSKPAQHSVRNSRASMAASFSLSCNLFHWWRQEAEMFETAATSEQINKNNIIGGKKTLSVNHFSQFILENLRAEMRNFWAGLSTQPSMQHFCSLSLSHSLTFSHSLSAFCLEALNYFKGWRTLCSCVACQLITPCLCLKRAHFRGYAESIRSNRLLCPHSQNKETPLNPPIYKSAP